MKRSQKMTNKTFIYYLYNRPPDIGRFPKENVINYESWIPRKKIDTFPRGLYFGKVKYSKKLTFKQIYDYELIPKNKTEYAKYSFWEKCGKNTTDAKKTEERYKKLNINELKEWESRDHFAYYTLLLLKKEKK